MSVSPIYQVKCQRQDKFYNRELLVKLLNTVKIIAGAESKN